MNTYGRDTWGEGFWAWNVARLELLLPDFALCGLLLAAATWFIPWPWWGRLLATPVAAVAPAGLAFGAYLLLLRYGVLRRGWEPPDHDECKRLSRM